MNANICEETTLLSSYRSAQVSSDARNAEMQRDETLRDVSLYDDVNKRLLHPNEWNICFPCFRSHQDLSCYAILGSVVLYDRGHRGYGPLNGVCKSFIPAIQHRFKEEL